MQDSFLLSSSTIFDNSTQIDRIRQSFIDLQTEPQPEEIEILLNEHIIPYLERKLSFEDQSEIFILIFSCFSHLTDNLIPIFNNFFTKSRLNANFIIVTAFTLLLIAEKFPESLSNYLPFVSEALDQIRPQIQSSDQKSLKVFGHEIPHQFRLELVTNLIIPSQITKELVSDFFPYILSQNVVPLKTKIISLIKKVSELGFTTFLPIPITIDKDFFIDLNEEQYLIFLPLLSDDTFQEIFPLIENYIQKVGKSDRQFSLLYLQRCCQHNMKIATADIIVKPLFYEDIKPETWKYLKSFNFVLSLKASLDVHDFPDPDYLFRILPDLTILPESYLSKLILECKDFNSYDNILFTRNFQHSILEKTEFWNHIVSISSQEECPKTLITKFARLFKNLFDLDSFTEIFDEMIFSNYPLNENGISFISSFLISLRSKYREVFVSQEHMDEFLSRLIQINIVPLPRFWEFVSFDSILQKLNFESKPLLLYGYEFARGKYFSNQSLPSLFYILDQTESSKEELVEFIRQNNLKYIVNMKDEALSLIASAFIFTRLKKKIKIDSITKKNILPFFAIGFNYIDKCKGNLNYTFPEYTTLIIEAVKKLGEIDSPLLNASIDSFFSHSNELSNPQLFPKSAFVQLYNIATSFLFKGQFKANKMILLSAIFNFSNNEQLKPLFNNHEKEILNCIFENLNDVIESDKFKAFKLNMKIFDPNMIDSFVFDYFKKSTTKETRNLIYFLLKMCNNIHSITFIECDFYIKSLNEAIKEKNYSDLLLFDQFKTSHSLVFWWQKQNVASPIEIPLEIQIKMKYDVSVNKINIDELLSIILNDPQPETNNVLFEYLFKALMREESIATDYITILLENFYNVHSLIPKTILTYFSKEFENYKPSFVKAVNRFYIYDHKSKSFIKKPDFESLSLPISEVGLSLISKLFNSINENPNNYQAFFCLRSIANSFPFLFIQNPQQIFDVVLPVLNDLSLLIEMKDENDEDKIKRAKTVSSALSFLLFTLSTPRILDAFVIWFFDNLNEFNTLQILGFILVIHCILGGKTRLVIYLKKFNLFERFVPILHRQIPKSIRDIFLTNVFSLISQYYEAIRSLTKIRYISLDSFNDDPNEFNAVFDNCLVHLPSSFQPTYFLNLTSNKTISNYLKSVDEIKPFYFTFDYRKNKIEAAVEKVDDFIQNFVKNSEEKNSEEEEEALPQLPPIPQNLTINMIKHVIKKRPWVTLYILCHYDLTLLPEHYEILIPIINELNEIEKNPQENDIPVANYNINYESLYCHDIFKFTIKNYKLLNEFFNQIILSQAGIDHMIESIKEILNEEPTSENIVNFIDIFNASTNYKFKNAFFSELKLIILNISLNPTFRSNEDILVLVSNFFLNNQTINLPIEITQLIGFLLLLNDDKVLPIALSLCKRIGIKNLDNVSYLLEIRFIKSIEITEFNELTISNAMTFITTFPDLLNQFQSLLCTFMSKLLNDYMETENDSSYNLFAILINTLAPKKNDNISSNMSDSYIYDLKKPIQEQLYTEIPQALKSQSAFWYFYESIQPKFMELIHKDLRLIDSFNFLREYPEVLDFQTRSKYFLQKMRSRINRTSRLFIAADRMDIVESSFNHLKNIDPEDFLNILRVTFVGEEIAIDEGGVTANWLYSLTQQIFNPINNLFDSFSTNGGYKPSSKSALKPDYLEYFKFAGRVVARSIIQNVCIDAHMAPFFYKYILHHPIKLTDLKELDEEKYESLQWCIENDIEELGLEMYFELDYEDSNGEVKTIELIENGSNIQVTNENKNDYALKVAEFYLIGTIKEQCDAFSEGFDSMIPHDQINIFTQGEMDLLICGITEFTDDDLKKLVILKRPYDMDTPVIKFFFSAVSKWNKEDRAKLLLFITSTSKFPANINDNNKILISRRPNSDYLPIAHTCFRNLELPEYESEEILNSKLLYAVQNCVNFAIG